MMLKNMLFRIRRSPTFLRPDGKFFTQFTDATEASDMAHALARLP